LVTGKGETEEASRGETERGVKQKEKARMRGRDCLLSETSDNSQKRRGPVEGGRAYLEFWGGENQRTAFSREEKRAASSLRRGGLEITSWGEKKRTLGSSKKREWTRGRWKKKNRGKSGTARSNTMKGTGLALRFNSKGKKKRRT